MYELVFMPLLPDILGNGVTFSGWLPRFSVHCSFVWTDIITTISREWLEQSQWNLLGIFASPCW